MCSYEYTPQRVRQRQPIPGSYTGKDHELTELMAIGNRLERFDIQFHSPSDNPEVIAQQIIDTLKLNV